MILEVLKTYSAWFEKNKLEIELYQHEESLWDDQKIAKLRWNLCLHLIVI